MTEGTGSTRGIGEAARFWRRVEQSSGCWLWRGRLDDGYGRLRRDSGSAVYAHRFAYELLVGPIPDGMTVDHVCHNADTACLDGKACPHRACVRPDHLEAVPAEVNTQRGHNALSAPLRAAARTHCPEGHPYSFLPNGEKRCLTCRTATRRARSSGRPTGRPATVDADAVLRLAAGGLTHAEIGAQLGCSPATVSRIKSGKQRTSR